MSLIGCTRQPTVQRVTQVPPADTIRHAGEPPIVYFTHNISPAGLMAAYEALGLEATGNVAIKVHTGEPGERQHFIKPEFMKDLVQRVNGTIVETNTITGGENFSRRATTAFHYQLAKDHGFTSIAPVIIMDETAEISIPVLGGKHLTENYIGARFNEFDFHIVLSHFKGHVNGGFGGALKNIAIGYASGAGKAWIHSGGVTRNTPNSVDVMRFFFTDNFQFRWDQDTFLESMAEAAKSITDQTRGRILYINVMNHLSVDCDCGSNPTVPTMADIGILASLDPVALDQACVDLVYSAPDGKDLIERIESLNGLLTLKYAEKLGVGSREYQLIQL
jgi:uncharacterized Fe-S center protein